MAGGGAKYDLLFTGTNYSNSDQSLNYIDVRKGKSVSGLCRENHYCENKSWQPTERTPATLIHTDYKVHQQIKKKMNIKLDWKKNE